MNERILNEIKDIDYDLVYQKLEKFLMNAKEESGSSGAMLGLSGGIDSTVIAYLCSKSRN